MQYFVISVDYRVPLERVQETSPAHRAYVIAGINQGLILCAGPRVPRDGGVIIARADSRASLENFFASDPYVREGLADYRYTEFAPLFHDAALVDWAGPA